jgi:hypothetical protein
MTLSVVERGFPAYHRANLQLAIDEALRAPDVQHELDGVVLKHNYEDLSLAKLSRKDTAKGYPAGPVEYQEVELSDEKSLACVKRGIYFIRTPSAPPLVMLVHYNPQPFSSHLSVAVMCSAQDAAQDFVRQITVATERAPAFRGKVISLETDCYRSTAVRFHRLPQIARGQIILPAAVLDRIDRHGIGFVKHADRLRAAGRHLKRGVLLHGPPGTGKTLCAMYLAGQMPGRTVMVLTGGAITSIENSGTMARALAPATVILEDVDLVGSEREYQTVGANGVLFELLNQMDGLAEDADVLFVLTTNRPELLEPALATRPGRVDQAIEIPLPDADCRRRLLHLYSAGLSMQTSNLDAIIQRTEGVSAAFIRELLRKAAILAVEQDHHGDGQGVVVHEAHLHRAIDELLIAGGSMAKRLMGFGAMEHST